MSNIKTAIILLLTLIGIFTLAKISQAADVTAASCSAADIQSAADQVKNAGGGTVYVPAGNCTHTDAVRMSDGVNLIGAGQGVTIIHNSHIAISTRFYGNLNKGFRVSGMSLYSGGSDPISLDTVHDFRLDHMYIETGSGDAVGASYSYSGVIDHCYIKLTNSVYGIEIAKTTDTYPTCWPSLTSILGKSDAIFIEDNTIEGTGSYHGTVGHGAAHYVVRHNTFIDASGSARIDAHGTGYPPFNCGTRLVEVYNNDFYFTNPGGGNNDYGMDCRGGSQVVFNNTWHNFDNGLVIFLDNGMDSLPYPQPMQPSGIWFWNNSFVNLGYGHESSCPCTDPTTQTHCCQVFLADFAQITDKTKDFVQLNREYFLRAPSQQLDGFTYTPYTYPHPLQGGGDTTAPAAPTGVSVN